MGKVKNHYHDEFERRRWHEAGEIADDEFYAEQDRAWAAAKAAKRKAA